MEELKRVEFTEEMRRDYTILVPNMLPTHFKILVKMFRQQGYRMEVLTNEGAQVVNTGLRYVHNDTCYPALLCIGQFINALQSGRYDLKKTALLLTQTGGGCRASNYIHLLRKALAKADMDYIPIISLNASGMEKSSGFRMTPTLVLESFFAILYGDMLMLLKNQAEPYETEKGAVSRLVDVWADRIADQFGKGPLGPMLHYKRNVACMVREFDAIPHTNEKKTRVGIVGEIYVKYSAMGNNHLEQFLLEQGCEVNVPGLLGFIAYCVDVRIDDVVRYGGSRRSKWIYTRIMDLITHYEKKNARIVHANSRFEAPRPIRVSKEHLDGMLCGGCKMGEGWLLTAEMIELIESGYSNIVCVQPFGCLPNHIVGKGTVRPLRERFPNANIVPIDYDPSATRVNQENRLKLMLAVARENEGARS